MHGVAGDGVQLVGLDVHVAQGPGLVQRSDQIADDCRRFFAGASQGVGDHGLLHELAGAGKSLVFFCAYGERSAMAVEAARAGGIEDARHLKGGIDAWKKAGGEIEAMAR